MWKLKGDERDREELGIKWEEENDRKFGRMETKKIYRKMPENFGINLMAEINRKIGPQLPGLISGYS